MSPVHHGHFKSTPVSIGLRGRHGHKGAATPVLLACLELCTHNPLGGLPKCLGVASLHNSSPFSHEENGHTTKPQATGNLSITPASCVSKHKLNSATTGSNWTLGRGYGHQWGLRHQSGGDKKQGCSDLSSFVLSPLCGVCAEPSSHSNFPRASPVLSPELRGREHWWTVVPLMLSGSHIWFSEEVCEVQISRIFFHLLSGQRGRGRGREERKRDRDSVSLRVYTHTRSTCRSLSMVSEDKLRCHSHLVRLRVSCC